MRISVTLAMNSNFVSLCVLGVLCGECVSLFEVTLKALNQTGAGLSSGKPR